jgi:DNA-binding NtrC family response regulator
MPTKELFRVFVVEDDDWFRQYLVHVVSLNPDYEVKAFANAAEFLKSIHEQPHAVTLDYMLPDSDGAKLLRKIKDHLPDTEVIVISEQEKIETALQLLKSGAFDYLVKSKHINESLLNSINNVRKQHELKNRVTQLEKEVDHKYSFARNIVGQSDAMKPVYEMIQKAISNNIVVSIYGETGTGKELVAKAIHYNSAYRKGKFVAVNMAAIPPDIAESELFGHEKGAFTGAIGTRVGKFEEADGGTIFLDEIAEMDMNLQAKLLRVLQEKEVIRVGSNKPLRINCRIIVASNKNLMEQVKKNKFREDLYYRVFGLPVKLPPLRDRGNDILVLAKYFMDSFCKENDMQKRTLSKDASQRLLSYPFPGNVRELKSVVELAVVMSNDNTITANDLMLGTEEQETEMINGEMTLDDYNKKIINHYLKKYNNNVVMVADKLGIGKSTIYRYLKEAK